MFADSSDKEETDGKGKPDLNVTLSEVNTLAKMLKPEYYRHMRNTIIADSSYVALCLGDYITSLQKAEELLRQGSISGNHKYVETSSSSAGCLKQSICLQGCSVTCMRRNRSCC